MENLSTIKLCKGYDCMKKYLAICSILFTVCTAFTGCGSSDTPTILTLPQRTKLVTPRKIRTPSVRISPTLPTVSAMQKDIIDGVTNAVGDIIDGFDGNPDSTHTTNKD